jgi:hypothetical protein
MSKKIDLIGKVYGRLIVIEHSKKTDASRQSFWLCKCLCGNTKEIGGRSLRRSDVVSCGCFGKEQRAKSNTKHGQYHSLAYTSWDSMIQRCTNPKHSSYARYGARGIAICEEWKSFENFYRDMGARPSKNHSIDRINNGLGYFKENCRWANKYQQAQNTKIFVTNTSGYKGVCFNNNEKKWVATIWVGNKQRHLGYFLQKEDAISARSEAEKALWLYG